MSHSIEQLSINTIRTLSIDAIEKKSNSGHPGMPMGAAPMAYTLWSQFMNHNPRNPKWFNRDRFCTFCRSWIHVAIQHASPIWL
ncbi:hypothetical protein GCM10020331_049670 [Ectobacillus funiculus]